MLAAIGLVAVAVRLLFGFRGSEGILESGTLTPLWTFLAVLVVGIGVTVAVARPMSRAERQFHQEFQRFLAWEHPHAPIIVGRQPRDLLARAAAAGASTDRIGHGGLVGLAVRQEGVEVLTTSAGRSVSGATSLSALRTAGWRSSLGTPDQVFRPGTNRDWLTRNRCRAGQIACRPRAANDVDPPDHDDGRAASAEGEPRGQWATGGCC